VGSYHELYDDYRPKFDYDCVHCGSRFSADKKKKTDKYFCSRICAGKYRRQTFVMSDNVKRKISQSLLGKKMQPYKRKHKQIWITEGKTNTRIKEGDVIPKGFVRGRSHGER
jgi:hypothetical protein